MFDDLKCSAHNQYGDVLFRTGFIGLFLYLYLLYKVFMHLKNNMRPFLWIYKYSGLWFFMRHLKCLKEHLFWLLF